VSDIGEVSAAKSNGLVRLSHCSESHSERDVEVLSRQYKIRLPVQISELKKSPGVRYMGSFKVISLRSWIEFLTNFNVWHVMLGLHHPDEARERAILTEFWRLYKAANPQHMLWQVVEENSVDLSKCLPILCHGDEGRGRKKSPFLITAYHSCLGFGTDLANSTRARRPYLSLRLNYCGSTHIHRMLTGCLPKMVKDEQAFKDLCSFMAADCVSMIEQGVESKHGGRVWAACLNIVGDWMWLAKAANLERSFSTVQKRPWTAASVPKGICHWCHAGRRGFDFEDMSMNAAHRGTMFLQGDQPWSTRPVFLDIPHDPSKPAAFFYFDLWHCFHLGMGKSFVASVFALISDRLPGGAVDARFAHLTDLYLQFCDEERTAPYITAITTALVGWPDRKTYPNGQWHKGHTTTAFCHFLERWFAVNNIAGDLLLRKSHEATVCINRCLHMLYASDLWLKPAKCQAIGQLGMRFLCLYQELAKISYDQNTSFYGYMPKSHILHHLFADLVQAQTTSMNCLAWAVQVDEDYIGKKSRLARRVAPATVVQRVIERTLSISYAHWHEAGYLKG